MSWVNKNEWNAPTPGMGRVNGKRQAGTSGDHVTPNAYTAIYGKGFNTNPPPLPNGARQPNFSLVGTTMANAFFASSVPFPAARNKAWNKFINDVRSGPASLGVAFAESSEALGMIISRCSQLYRGYRNLRHGNFRGFLRTFGIGAKRKHRNKIRNKVSEASSLWLEYSFGWSPLMQDIHDGFSALGQPVPGGPCQGKGSEDWTYNYRPHNGSGERWNTRGRCRIRADVYVTNPNLYALQQMGLANPAQIVWELVPFSFVVDWVFDVGTCLGALTDLLGCTVLHPTTTYSVVRSSLEVRWYWDDPPQREYLVQGTVSMVRRKTSLDYPLPNISFHANIGQSIKRAANAASLLGQILTK